MLDPPFAVGQGIRPMGELTGGGVSAQTARGSGVKMRLEGEVGKGDPRWRGCDKVQLPWKTAEQLLKG